MSSTWQRNRGWGLICDRQTSGLRVVASRWPPRISEASLIPPGVSPIAASVVQVEVYCRHSSHFCLNPSAWLCAPSSCPLPDRLCIFIHANRGHVWRNRTWERDSVLDHSMVTEKVDYSSYDIPQCFDINLRLNSFYPDVLASTGTSGEEPTESVWKGGGKI